MQSARQRLIQVNHSEARIEQAEQQLHARQHNDQPDKPEADVKDVVRRGAAGQALLWRDQKTGDASQNEQGSENGESNVVAALLIY